MKKYETPKAEKIEFDYTVTACASNGNGNQQPQGTDVSNPYWECKSPNYWGC